MKDLVILLVDDEPALLNLLSVRLGIFGSKILTALNGHEALDVLSQHPVDIIVCDIQMPLMNGLELLDHVRKKNPCSPSVLFATAFADNAEVEEYYARGVDGVFAKPLDSKALLAAARQITKSKEEIWSAPPSVEPAFHLTQTFDSLAKAQKDHLFNIGRGGFFTAFDKTLPELNSLISFHISFLEGPLQMVKGIGHIRWSRTLSKKKLPAGVGVDLIYLTDESRPHLIRYIESTQMLAFIPRS